MAYCVEMFLSFKPSCGILCLYFCLLVSPRFYNLRPSHSEEEGESSAVAVEHGVDEEVWVDSRVSFLDFQFHSTSIRLTCPFSIFQLSIPSFSNSSILSFSIFPFPGMQDSVEDTQSHWRGAGLQ